MHRPLPEDVYGPTALEHPLVNRRKDLIDPALGEDLDSLPLLERLLRCESTDAHSNIAAALWDSTSCQDAKISLESVAEQHLMEWEQSESSGDVQVAQG
jgi:hypothetical protein